MSSNSVIIERGGFIIRWTNPREHSLHPLFHTENEILQFGESIFGHVAEQIIEILGRAKPPELRSSCILYHNVGSYTLPLMLSRAINIKTVRFEVSKYILPATHPFNLSISRWNPGMISKVPTYSMVRGMMANLFSWANSNQIP
jgi:hypothetical protein